MKKQTKPKKELVRPNSRAGLRIMDDEADEFFAALQATGMTNVSKAVKTAVFAYPKHLKLCEQVEALRSDIAKLTRAVESQGSLIVALRGERHD